MTDANNNGTEDDPDPLPVPHFTHEDWESIAADPTEHHKWVWEQDVFYYGIPGWRCSECGQIDGGSTPPLGRPCPGRLQTIVVRVRP